MKKILAVLVAAIMVLSLCSFASADDYTIRIYSNSNSTERATWLIEKAKEAGGKVLNASVAIHTAICPECGRTYVSGGTTTTQIKYPNENNPYQRNRKNADGTMLAGMNFDAVV
jgi:hypothetical protein